MFAVGEDGHGHGHFTEAGALTPEDFAAVQEQVRARVRHELPDKGQPARQVHGVPEEYSIKVLTPDRSDPPLDERV